MANILMKKILCLLMMALLPCMLWGYGNHQTLEIINVKAAGTGSPSISSNNRIFWAYPGITYSIPVGVIGGTFPYTFSLSGAPSGMTIDSHTGVVTWTNPTSDSGTITVTVYDKDGHSTTAQWAITVTSSTTRFLFVDDSASVGGDGTITTPYDTIQDILDLGSAAVNKIVYLRTGTYDVPIYNPWRSSPGAWGCNLNGVAHIWVAYPNESVTWNMRGVNESNAAWIELNYDATGQDEVWLEGMTIQSPRTWGLRSANTDYANIWKITMTDIVGTTLDGNHGGWYAFYSGAVYYNYLCDSSFTNATSAYLVGSIYGFNKSLFERNIMDGATGSSQDEAALILKQSNNYCTIRKNEIHNTDTAFHTWDTSNYNEICFNYITVPTGRFNLDENQGTLWCYRNTFTARVEMSKLDYPDSCEGPWYFENNVIQSSDDGIYYNAYCSADASSCVTDSNNISGTSGIVDTSGNLQGEYTSYLGTAGWQIDESEYYDSSPSTPSIRNGGVRSGGFR